MSIKTLVFTESGATLSESGEVVELSKANQLGQVVKGTSPNSEYICVARAEKAALAVRVASTLKVSARIEPVFPYTMQDIVQQAGAMGLSISGDSHASTHLGSSSAMDACMSVAAYTGAFHWMFGGEALSFEQLRPVVSVNL